MKMTIDQYVKVQSMVVEKTQWSPLHSFDKDKKNQKDNRKGDAPLDKTDQLLFHMTWIQSMFFQVHPIDGIERLSKNESTRDIIITDYQFPERSNS